MEFAHERLPSYQAAVGFVSTLGDALGRVNVANPLLSNRAHASALEIPLAIARAANTSDRDRRNAALLEAAAAAADCCVYLDLLLRARALGETDHGLLRERLLRLGRAVQAQGGVTGDAPEAVSEASTMDGTDRREAARHALLFPMKVDVIGGTDGVAVSRDVGKNGLLMATALELAAGSPVSVTFQLEGRDVGPRVVRGRIVRVSVNEEDPEGLWPYKVAVVFDNPVPEIEPLIAHGLATQALVDDLPDETA